MNVCLRSSKLGWLNRMAKVSFGPLVAVGTIYKRQTQRFGRLHDREFSGMVIGRRTEIIRYLQRR
jgi:hypothetical protein